MIKKVINIAINFNGLYLFCNFYYHHQKKLQNELIVTDAERHASYADHLYLRVSHDKEELRVRVSDIAYIYRTQRGALVLRQYDANSIILWESLDALQKVNPELFCRISRNFIITRDAVARRKKHPDRGKIIELNPSCDEIAKVSHSTATTKLTTQENRQGCSK